MRFIGGIMVGLLAGWVLSSFLWSPLLDRWIASYKSVSTRLDYYSSGAIAHDIVGICKMDDKLGVYFHEDCDAP